MTEQRNSLRRDRDEDEDLQKQTKCCKELQDKIFDILKENGIVFDRTQILKKAIEVENNNDHVSGFVLETDLDKFVNLRCDLCLTTNPNNDDENDPAKLENQQQECLSLGLLLFGMFCFSGTQNVDKLDNVLIKVSSGSLSINRQLRTTICDELSKIASSFRASIPKTIFDVAKDSGLKETLFPRVFASEGVERSFNIRYVSIDCMRPLQPLKESDLPPNHDKHGVVMIVAGASGSGKTIYALNLATRYDKNGSLTIYLLSTEIELAGWQEHYPYSNSDEDQTRRKVNALSALLRAIDAVLSFYGVNGVPSSPRWNSQKHLYVIIDEIGICPVFVKTLCEISKLASVAIQRRYLEKYQGDINDTTTTTTPPRVHLIVAGTGAIYDNSNTNSTIKFLPETRPDLFQYLLNEPTIRERLETIKVYELLQCRNDSEPSPAQTLLGHLVKNARCASLCMSLAIANRSSLRQRSRQHDDDDRERYLYNLAESVIFDYMRLNKLASYKYPVNILVTAMSAAAHHLKHLASPTIVEVAETVGDGFKMVNAYGSPQRIDFFFLLCTQAGVLVPKQTTTTNNNNICRVFNLSPPFAAMTKLKLGISENRPFHWSEFEHRVADYCYMLACASPVMPYLLQAEQRSANFSPSTKTASPAAGEDAAIQSLNASTDADASEILKPLREWLMFRNKPATGGVHSCSFEHKMVFVPSNENSVAEYRQEAIPVIAPLLAENYAVIILSAENESFADITVLGPDGTIILLLCKKFTTTKPSATLNFEKDFNKLALPKKNRKILPAVDSHIKFLKSLYPNKTKFELRHAILCECSEQTVVDELKAKFESWKKEDAALQEVDMSKFVFLPWREQDTNDQNLHHGACYPIGSFTAPQTSLKRGSVFKW